MLEDNKTERIWKAKLQHKAFLEEFLMNDENRKWAKKRRIKYLVDRLAEITKVRTRQPVIPDWVEELIEEEINQPIIKESEKIISEIKLLLKPRVMDGINDEMIEQAKQYPITNLLGEPTMNKYICPFHNDKNPSMHYYPETNSLYCFSCGESADVIKLYQHLNNCSFIEAVKSLN